MELDHEVLSEYPMTFTEYLEEREARRERIAAQNVQLDKKIAQLERFAERFGAKNTKAAQAHSKRRQADRLRQRRVVLPRKPRTIRFQFPAPPHVGRVMVQLRDASFAYDSRDIFHDANLEIQKGEKIAIVGANGAGKTTLLRVLAGQLDPREGEREIHRRRSSAISRSTRPRSWTGSSPCSKPWRKWPPTTCGSASARFLGTSSSSGTTSSSAAASCRAGSASASRSRAFC